MPLPSAAQIIHSRLETSEHDEWGWVIYRCTHNNDAACTRFKELVQKHSSELIAESDVPEAANSLQWTFVGDRQSLYLRLERQTPDTLQAMGR